MLGFIEPSARPHFDKLIISLPTFGETMLQLSGYVSNESNTSNSLTHPQVSNISCLFCYQWASKDL